MTTSYTNEDPGKVSIDIAINIEETNKTKNYIKTLWLLNKEPELEILLEMLDYALKAAEVEQLKSIKHREEEQKRQWVAEAKYAHEQNIQEQLLQNKKLAISNWTSDTDANLKKLNSLRDPDENYYWTDPNKEIPPF